MINARTKRRNRMREFFCKDNPNGVEQLFKLATRMKYHQLGFNRCVEWTHKCWEASL